jgi:hypothetical protein
MKRKSLSRHPEITTEHVYIAGQKVSPGRYRLVGSERDVLLDREDTLPASLDGKVAEYILWPETWAERASAPKDKVAH